MKISPLFFTETTVSCSETEYACSSGRCIPARWQCDREQDCDDGSDESEDICGKLFLFFKLHHRVNMFYRLFLMKFLLILFHAMQTISLIYLGTYFKY